MAAVSYKGKATIALIRPPEVMVLRV